MTHDAASTRYEGTCSFRLMRDDPLQEGPSSATLTRVGAALVLRYTWQHPDDGPQEGVLLVGDTPESGPVEVTLFDTWHQQPGLMRLTGQRDGDAVEVSALWAGDWAWEVALRLEGTRATMTMRNVVSESAVQDLPSAGPAKPAGPYDVMVAAWSVVDD